MVEPKFVLAINLFLLNSFNQWCWPWFFELELNYFLVFSSLKIVKFVILIQWPGIINFFENCYYHWLPLGCQGCSPFCMQFNWKWMASSSTGKEV